MFNPETDNIYSTAYIGIIANIAYCTVSQYILADCDNTQHRHVREVIRTNYFNYSTKKTHVGWLEQFIIFHNHRHTKDIGFNLSEEITVRLFEVMDHKL